ncbi:L-lactate permease [Caballeronia mineralivorans]|jgi:lactate permease|uniref:L-lactate permease n=1 Tax=Caballeronia mineralivorans TaxID=2010198 RepID=UPI0023F37AFF|nr:lactate permease LctP family transporter [Caballeronia mineralivorans]MDB5785809.1 L-lactate transport [Caballeronia mineralivorans]MEA3098838.1 lactate permease [Caballeronia mineralivorans]
MYQQTYDPLGNAVLSTVVAAIPILTLLYFIALHRHRDAQGNVHLGISAPYAAFFGVVAAFIISCLVFRMPVVSAVSAFALGSLSGFLGIIWIVLAAMFLYTMSVVTGKFEIVKESIVHISFDRRLQCVLIAFSFGAIIEGTSGFGTPVAIAGAVMVGLGFRPFQSAVLNLLANTAPVAWGAIGTPIVTLAAVSGLDQVTLSSMAGRQLPIVSVLVPFWLVATFVKMEGGSWKEVFEVWPAMLCAGGSFALMQFFASGTNALHLMTDVVSGVFSVICTALFLRFVWHPKTRFLLRSEREAIAQAGKRTETATTDSTDWKYKYSATQTAHAWMPWVILIACCALWGVPEFKKILNNLFSGITFTTTLLGSKFSGSLSLPVWDMPALHNLVQRMPPVAAVNAQAEAARFTINWLSTAGTGVFVAALLSGLVLKMNATQWKDAFVQTMHRLKIPVLVIAQVLGLGFLTRYSGTDAVLGLAFTGAGFFYPFFAAYLGWLGVFLTGSDTASNALFGSLQRITAQQLNLNPILIVATNSTGGVMGKMIDAQSIMVACAACYDDPKERSFAMGPIFRTVFFHSIAGAAVIGVIAMLQAYVFPWMIPIPPVGK